MSFFDSIFGCFSEVKGNWTESIGGKSSRERESGEFDEGESQGVADPDWEDEDDRESIFSSSKTIFSSISSLQLSLENGGLIIWELRVGERNVEGVPGNDNVPGDMALGESGWFNSNVLIYWELGDEEELFVDEDLNFLDDETCLLLFEELVDGKNDWRGEIMGDERGENAIKERGEVEDEDVGVELVGCCGTLVHEKGDREGEVDREGIDDDDDEDEEFKKEVNSLSSEFSLIPIRVKFSERRESAERGGEVIEGLSCRNCDGMDWCWFKSSVWIPFSEELIWTELIG